MAMPTVLSDVRVSTFNTCKPQAGEMTAIRYNKYDDRVRQHNHVHTCNVVYPPFVEETTGVCRPPPDPPSPNVDPPLPGIDAVLPGIDLPLPGIDAPLPDNWTATTAVGDCECGFRVVARAVYADPAIRNQARVEIVHCANMHRHNIDFHVRS